MNSLSLSGADAGGAPHVSVDQISIDARTIDVALEDRQIDAIDVKTTLSPQKGSKPLEQERGSGIAIPGLLRQNEVAQHQRRRARVSRRGRSGRLSRQGHALAGSRRRFAAARHQPGSGQGKSGRRRGRRAPRWNSIRVPRSARRRDPLRRRQAPRDLQRRSASTDKREGFRLCRSEERGAADAKRAVPVRDAQLRGPQGDLRAERIEIVLAKQDNKVERLEGYTRVTLKLDMRTAVGARLTYYASEERYVMSAAGTIPVTVTDPQTAASGAVSCRATTGRTLTFYKSTDTITRRRERSETHRDADQAMPAAVAALSRR